MKNKRQRARDLELLSAYLDSTLRPAERQALVARLQHEPDLQTQLDKLRKTKLTLAALPHLHAPRNYTLTPEMVTVRAPKQQPFVGTLRLATALSAVLLVVLFGAEFLLTRGTVDRPQLAAKPMMEAAMLYDEVEPAPLIFWGQLGTGGGEGDAWGMGGDMAAMEAPLMMESVPVEVEEAPVVETEVEILPEAEPEFLLEAERDMHSFAAEVEKGLLILGINLDEAGEIIQRSTDTFQPEPPQPAWRTGLRVLQIALGTLAIGSGLAWWLLRKTT